MHQSMRRVQRGLFIGYTCDRLPVRHVFTTKAGGVSTGHCESLNLGFNRGDDERNVRENYRRLAQAVGVNEARFTLTKQITRPRSRSSPRPRPAWACTSRWPWQSTRS